MAAACMTGSSERSPTMTSMGSPGIMRISANVISVMPKKVGTSTPSLRRMKENMLNESPVHALVGHDVYSQKRRQTGEVRQQQRGKRGVPGSLQLNHPPIPATRPPRQNALYARRPCPALIQINPSYRQLSINSRLHKRPASEQTRRPQPPCPNRGPDRKSTR